MGIRSLSLLLAVLFAGVVSAQASVSISDTVGDSEEHLYLFDVDFGATPQSITVTLDIGATSGTSGLNANIVDLDELAANGSLGAINAGGDPGTGTFSVSLTTPSYSGVRQFAAQIRVNAQNGPSPYTGDLSAAALSPGDITQVGMTTLPAQAGDYDLLGRGKRYAVQTLLPDNFTRDMQVDFGATPQAITFWAQGFSFADGSVEVYEIDSLGAENHLGTLSLNSGNGFEEEANLTTSSRSGTVTIRTKINAASASIYVAQLVLPGTTTTDVPPGGGNGDGGDGGGDDDGGCTTGGSTGWMMWLALLAVGAVAGRRLRQWA